MRRGPRQATSRGNISHLHDGVGIDREAKGRGREEGQLHGGRDRGGGDLGMTGSRNDDGLAGERKGSMINLKTESSRFARSQRPRRTTLYAPSRSASSPAAHPTISRSLSDTMPIASKGKSAAPWGHAPPRRHLGSAVPRIPQSGSYLVAADERAALASANGIFLIYMERLGGHGAGGRPFRRPEWAIARPRYLPIKPSGPGGGWEHSRRHPDRGRSGF